VTQAAPSTRAPARFGRYLLCDPIGGGGMATVHLGRALGAGGFSRLVAIKRLHRARAKDPRFATMLIDEARMVSRIRHPNVVPTLDVVAVGSELLLVMEYVPGVALSRLVWLAQAQNERIPLPIATRIVLDVLAGLEAAHTAVSERGRALGIVHRDVSPQNLICGADGIVRVVDFGIAKAEGKLSVTREGEIKGKVPYMAPEQLRGEEVDRRADLYATGIVLWELFAGRRLFETSSDFGAAIAAAQTRVVPPVSQYADVPTPVEAVLMRALAASPGDRYESAAAMTDALEGVAGAATSKELAAFVNRLGASALSHLGDLVADVEQLSEVASLAAMEAPATEPADAPPFSTVPLPGGGADTVREAQQPPLLGTVPVAPAPQPAPGPVAPTRISATPLAPAPALPPPPPTPPTSLPPTQALAPGAVAAPRPRRGLVLVTVAVVLLATMLVVGLSFRGGVARRMLGGGRGHPAAEDAPSGAERPGHTGRRRGSP
jgi:eukaryotic-like serine/threonine-protein kinase